MSNITCTTTDSFYAISRDDKYKFIHLVFGESLPYNGLSPVLGTWGDWYVENDNFTRNIHDLAIASDIEKK